ncbi:MAG: peptidase domain-containing ABC transporter, partial [Bacteroidales bacterium]|nr:peptidase domain-containing ABC transporter [Bacteroidales bacterium]
SASRDLSVFEEIDAPCIIHYQKENGDLHFMVYCATTSKGYDVMDPALGDHRVISAEELSKGWTGYLVTVVPDKGFVPKSTVRPFSSTMASIASRFKGELAVSVLASLVYIAIGISSSYFLQQVIDVVIPSGSYQRLLSLGAVMGSLAVAAFAVGYLRVRVMLKTAVSIDYKLITDYVTHLFRLPVSFFSLRGSGELNSRIDDAMNIRNFITGALTSLAVSVITIVISFALMFSFHSRLALFTLMFMPVYAVLYIAADKVNRRVNRDIIESSAEFEQKTVEGISAAQTVKYIGAEKMIVEGIRRRYLKLSSKVFKGGRYAGAFALSSDFVSKMLTVMLLTVGAIFIFKGNLSVGELASFYSMTAFFTSPLSQLVEINSMMTEAGISARRLFEIMDFEPEHSDGFSLELSEKDDIKFENVDFSYPGGLPVMENFSCVIPGGKITAIVGESGCGKSSLAALLMRGYRPAKGSITVRNIDIAMSDMHQWRKNVAMVPQETVLLDTTILDNITFADSSPDLEKVAALIVELGMTTLVESLPLGLMTKVGERGCTLSGGQKQRIALARALYRNPKVLILDEATSSLDSDSEKFILEKVKQLRDSGMTIVMITHKSENVGIADKVIKMSARS